MSFPSTLVKDVAAVAGCSAAQAERLMRSRSRSWRELATELTGAVARECTQICDDKTDAKIDRAAAFADYREELKESLRLRAHRPADACTDFMATLAWERQELEGVDLDDPERARLVAIAALDVCFEIEQLMDRLMQAQTRKTRGRK